MSSSPREREQRILTKVHGDVVSRGGEHFLDRHAALEFVAMCEQDNLAVIGIEGFRVTENGTQPDLEYIADYSSRLDAFEWPAVRCANNDDAKRFIELAPNILYFSFVVAAGPRG